MNDGLRNKKFVRREIREFGSMASELSWVFFRPLRGLCQMVGIRPPTCAGLHSLVCGIQRQRLQYGGGREIYRRTGRKERLTQRPLREAAKVAKVAKKIPSTFGSCCVSRLKHYERVT
jgi:hypothetical protein